MQQCYKAIELFYVQVYKYIRFQYSYIFIQVIIFKSFTSLFITNWPIVLFIFIFQKRGCGGSS